MVDRYSISLKWSRLCSQKVSFYITGEKSPREFKAKKDDDVLEVVTTIVSHLRNTLPLTPYQWVDAFEVFVFLHTLRTNGFVHMCVSL